MVNEYMYIITNIITTSVTSFRIVSAYFDFCLKVEIKLIIVVIFIIVHIDQEHCIYLNMIIVFVRKTQH